MLTLVHNGAVARFSVEAGSPIQAARQRVAADLATRLLREVDECNEHLPQTWQLTPLRHELDRLEALTISLLRRHQAMSWETLASRAATPVSKQALHRRLAGLADKESAAALTHNRSRRADESLTRLERLVRHVRIESSSTWAWELEGETRVASLSRQVKDLRAENARLIAELDEMRSAQ